MRDGVMTYLYLTSVFFTSLERSTEEKSQREGAGEEKRDPARGGMKLWEGTRASKDAQGWVRRREAKLSKLCHTEGVKRNPKIKNLAKCLFNAGGLSEPFRVSANSVWCGYCDRKLNSSKEQLSTDPTYYSVKSNYKYLYYNIFYSTVNAAYATTLMNHGTSTGLHQLSPVLLQSELWHSLCIHFIKNSSFSHLTKGLFDPES